MSGALDEPVAVVMRRFQCPACRRTFSRRNGAVSHMATCPSRPENRACKTCAHLERHDDYAGNATCAEGVDFHAAIREEHQDAFTVYARAAADRWHLRMRCELWEGQAK